MSICHAQSGTCVENYYFCVEVECDYLLNNQYQFTAYPFWNEFSSCGDVVITYQWDVYNDGTYEIISPNPTVTYTFPDNQIYEVCVTAIDNYMCESTETCFYICPRNATLCELYGDNPKDRTIGSTCNSTTTTYASSLNTSTFSNEDILINGVLIVDRNVSFINCNIEICSGGSIDIRNGYTLTSEASNYYACEELWQGIEVFNGARIQMNKGVNKIQDALIGVDLWPLSTANFQFAEFNRNNIGIRMLGDNGIHHGNVFLEQITDCVFDSDHDLNDPFSGQGRPTGELGYCGIFAAGVKAAIVSAGSPNEFYNLANGIICENSTSTIANAYFQDIPRINDPIHTVTGNGILARTTSADRTGKLIQEGLGKTVTTFDNCITGIKANRVTCKITDNKMINVKKGIEISNAIGKSIEITDNDLSASLRCIDLINNDGTNNILINNNNITINGNISSSIGVSVQESQTIHSVSSINDNVVSIGNATGGIILHNTANYIVRDNSITLTQHHIFYGIYSYTGSGNQILKNTITGQGITGGIPNYSSFNNGIVVLNSLQCNAGCNIIDKTQQGIWIRGGCQHSDIFRNTFEFHTTGLLYDQMANTNEQWDKLNEWTEDAQTGEYQAQNLNAMFLNSVFFVHTNDFSLNADFFPSPVDPTAIWFRSYPFPAPVHPISCQSLAPSPILCTDFTLLESDSLFLIDSLIPENYHDVYSWEYELYLFRMAGCNPDERQGHPILDTFYQESLNTEIDHLALLKGEIEALFGMDSMTQVFVTEASNEVNTWLDSLYILNTQLTAADSAGSEAIYDLKDTVRIHLTFWSDSVQVLTEQVVLDRRSCADSLMANVKNINTTTTTGENYRFIYESFLHTIARDIDTLPPSDSILLDSLAHACIYEVGGIQALAQSIDRYIDGSDEVYSTYDSCTFPASRIQTTHVFDDLSKANSLKVYPNPVNSILNIEVGDGYEKAIINILDASGRRVMSTTTFRKRTRTDISALGSGIYFISLTGHGFSPVYQKFVKL